MIFIILYSFKNFKRLNTKEKKTYKASDSMNAHLLYTANILSRKNKTLIPCVLFWAVLLYLGHQSVRHAVNWCLCNKTLAKRATGLLWASDI